LRIERELVATDDIAALVADCRKHETRSTILDLKLSGRLSASDRAVLDAELAHLARDFVHTSAEQEFYEPLDAATIEQTYRRGGLAERLLTALVADAEHPDAATLAHELIEEALQK